MSESTSTRGLTSRVIVTAGSAALGTAAAMKDPTFAVAGPAVGAAAPDVILHYGSRARDMFDGLMRRGARDGNVDALSAHLEQHPEAYALLEDSARTLARTSDDVKINTIRSEFERGVLYEEGTTFDVDANVVRIILGLERPHLVVLMHSEEDDVPDRDELSRLHPNYAGIMPNVLGELVRLGLASVTHEWGNGTATTGDIRALTDLGFTVRRRILDAQPLHAETT